MNRRILVKSMWATRKLLPDLLNNVEKAFERGEVGADVLVEEAVTQCEDLMQILKNMRQKERPTTYPRQQSRNYQMKQIIGRRSVNQSKGNSSLKTAFMSVGDFPKQMNKDERKTFIRSIGIYQFLKFTEDRVCFTLKESKIQAIQKRLRQTEIGGMYLRLRRGSRGPILKKTVINDSQHYPTNITEAVLDSNEKAKHADQSHEFESQFQEDMIECEDPFFITGEDLPQ
jgi:hypothetical protein